MPEETQYIILLRGVNVSGKNILKMSLLKESLSKNGFSNVSTYIQSGNIILKSSHSIIETHALVDSILKTDFSLNVPFWLLQLSDLQKALHENPYDKNIEPNKIFVTFLSQVPDPLLIEKLNHIDLGEETFHIKNNILYYHLPNGMAKSKLNNNFFENKLKLVATGRNINTILKLIDLVIN